MKEEALTRRANDSRVARLAVPRSQ
jgi:hypothetical protein